MFYKACGDTYFVRLARGEDVIEAITELCKKEDIALGHVTGLGAVDKVTMGLFDVEKKMYHKKSYDGEYEIVSLIGNVTRKDGEVYLHLHMGISDITGAMYGGHLNYARISATGEIVVTRVAGEVGRRFDEELGLILFDL